MALDPSISLQVGRGVPQIDVAGAATQAMNLRALAQQSQLQDLQLQQQQRQMADQEAMRGAYVVGPDGRIDNAATLRNLARVNPAMAQEFSFKTQQNELASLKAAREAEKQQLEVVGKRLELTRNGLAALGPNATYADAMRVAMSLRGQGVPVDVNEIPQDPAQLQQYLQEQRIQTEAIFRNYRQMTGAGSKIAELQAALQNARTPEEQQQIRNQIDIETRGQPDAAVRLDPVTGAPTVNQAALDAKVKVAKAGASTQPIYMPGSIPASKPTQTKLEDSLLSTGQRLGKLNQISSMFKPEYLEVANRMKGGWTALKEKLGASPNPQDKQFLADFSKFKRSSVEMLNQYINEVTGAAVGVQEAPRLISAMPNAGSGLFDGDSPTEFKAKMDDITKQLRMAEARQVYAIRNGLTLFNDKGAPLIPLERMPEIMKNRYRQIEMELSKQNPKAPKKEIVTRANKQLGAEFGLATD